MSDGFIIKRGGGSSDGVDPSIIERTATNITADMLKGVTSIRDYAFYHCSSLTSIEIPNSVTSIGDSAFYICTSLTSIKIPNSVTSIMGYTFYGCTSLTSVTIPNSVTSIFQSAFASSNNLTSVTVQATTPPTLYNNVFVGTSSNLVIYVPAESVDAYKVAGKWSDYASKIQAIPSD